MRTITRPQTSRNNESLAIDAMLARRGNCAISAAQQAALEEYADETRIDLRGEPSVEVLPFSLGESRSLTPVIPTSGGYLVDQGSIISRIEQSLQLCSPVRQVAEVIRTEQGGVLAWPLVSIADDEGEIIAPGSTRSSSDITCGQLMLGAFTFSSKILQVSRELLEDADPAVREQLWQILGERVGRAQNRTFTTGTGSAQPYGFITRGTSGRTAASATSLSYADVCELVGSADPAYRMNGTFQCHANILTALRELSDGNGQPILSLGEGREPTLLGYPVLANLHMDSTIASGKKTLAFGDFSKYKIRDVRQAELVLFWEAYAELDKVGLMVRLRSDGNLADGGNHPVKFITH